MSQTYYPDTRASVNFGNLAEVLALKKTGVSSYAGPCPRCGGTDRFWVNTSTDGGFGCRQCGSETGFYEAVLRAAGLWQEREERAYRTGFPTCPTCRLATPARNAHTRQATYYSPTADRENCVHRAGSRKGLLGIHGREAKHVGLNGASYALLEWPPKEDNIRIPAHDRVVLVEGEKAAAAVRYAGITAYSWQGGTNTVARADYTRMQGVTIVLWPDADAPGVSAMLTAAEKLAEAGATIAGWVDTETMPEKGDAADVDANAIVRMVLDAGPEFAPPEPVVKEPRKVRPARPEPVGEPPTTYEISPEGHTYRLLKNHAARLMMVYDDSRMVSLRVAEPSGMWGENFALLSQWLTDDCAQWLADIEERGVSSPLARQSARRATSEAGKGGNIGGLQVAGAYGSLHREGPKDAADAITHCDDKDLDANTRYIGAPNGVIDLHTGALIKGDKARGLFITRRVPDPYNPDATHEDITALFGHLSEDIRAYIISTLAFALRGRPSRRINVLVGPPKGGKSTLMSAVTAALGGKDDGYSMNIDVSSLTQTRWVTPNGHRAGLIGVQDTRIATVMEPPNKGAALNEGLLKELSGGDELQLREMYKTSGKARAAKATIFIICNDVDADRIGTSEAGIADRVKILPYPRVPTADPGLIARVTEVAEVRQAMVALLVKESAALGKNPDAPAPPTAVIEATAAHFAESLGELGRWLHDNFVATGSRDDRMTVAEVKAAAAAAFPPEDGKVVGPYSQKAFTPIVLNAIQGLERARQVYIGGRKVHGYVGLRRRTEDEIETLADIDPEEFMVAVAELAEVEAAPEVIEAIRTLRPGREGVISINLQIGAGPQEDAMCEEARTLAMATGEEVDKRKVALEAMRVIDKTVQDTQHLRDMPKPSRARWRAFADKLGAYARDCRSKGMPYRAYLLDREAKAIQEYCRKLERGEL